MAVNIPPNALTTRLYLVVLEASYFLRKTGLMRGGERLRRSVLGSEVSEAREVFCVKFRWQIKNLGATGKREKEAQTQLGCLRAPKNAGYSLENPLGYPSHRLSSRV